MSTDQPRRWASVQTTASYLECEHKLVRRLIRRGDLTAYQLGGLLRLDLNEVDAFLCKR